MRNRTEVRHELDRLPGRRARVLQLLAKARRANLTVERQGLDARIAALWDEQRKTRATILFGTRSSIVKRARRAERILRDPAREGTRAA